ncbi:DUF4157 domain-containing protein [Micromonospora sp. NPDC049559]|uniref:eCIS core domain-containing protein n=1 Tax=Micromonospora sp. NPDC049559 TaxID=3155923 RepID=UPI00342FDB27
MREYDLPQSRDRHPRRPEGAESPSAPAARAGPRTRAGLLALQRTAGNRAVSRMLAAGGGKAGPGKGGDRAGGAAGGTGLPTELQARMEEAFDADFSGVRVHRDSAHADTLGVRAYTRGEEIHLASEHYRPETESGQALIGHELAHVVQQRQGRVGVTGQARGHEFNDDHGLESEAETLGRRAARGESARVGDGTRSGATTGAPALQASGIELLKAKDPAPADTSPVPDWQTLKGRAAAPNAVDVHHILKTYQQLSDGWKSGLGQAQQSLANKYATAQGAPDTVVAYGGTVSWNGMQRGRQMTATMLSMKGGAGSDATTGAYAGLGSAVEGHLLNAYLHGPASFENLAPFSQTLNKKHLKEIEDPLKRMIYNQNRFFAYQVVVQDGASTVDGGFYPAGIQCHVVELAADGTPKAGGYQRNIQINQAGAVTAIGTNTAGATASPGPLSFGADLGLNGADAQLAKLWNDLSLPWKGSYGAVVAEVLETAYAAVRRYQASQGETGNRLLALPQTEVEFETGSIRNVDDEDEEIGTKMLARPLTLRPPASGQTGSVPVEPWGGVIAGHLLNHHLHGPGLSHNLVPMTASLNQRFEREVESRVKSLVLTGGQVLSFEVEMGGDLIDLAGLEDVPGTLRYTVREYRPRPGAGRDRENFQNWVLGRTLFSGSLPNHSGRSGDDDDYGHRDKRRRTGD